MKKEGSLKIVWAELHLPEALRENWNLISFQDYPSAISQLLSRYITDYFETWNAASFEILLSVTYKHVPRYNKYIASVAETTIKISLTNGGVEQCRTLDQQG